MRFLNVLARRFVAGETAEEAITAAGRANEKGINAILDYLGEDVISAGDAGKAADEYVRLLNLIHEHPVRASVSLKMSQMGILVSRETCAENVRRVIQEADRLGLFVWFDMEGSALTQQTMDIFQQMSREFSNLGLCLQACLVRTGGNVDELLRAPRRRGALFHVRLCKGAYKEPPAIAYTTHAAVTGNFRMLAQKLLEQAGTGAYPAFATHDRGLVEFLIALAREKSIGPDHFEFQMLYGIQNAYLASLVKQGYRGNVYIPYGTHWFPYFLRRLRERKENIYFLLRNVLRA